MIARLLLWRVAALIGVMWRRLRISEEEGVVRWPDKSTAVGVGAGDWKNSIISAVAQNALLALQAVYPIISMHNAPSTPPAIANCSHWQ